MEQVKKPWKFMGKWSKIAFLRDLRQITGITGEITSLYDKSIKQASYTMFLTWSSIFDLD